MHNDKYKIGFTLRRLIPDPFIIALLATVGLASFLPAQGLVAEIVDVIATAAIVLLFFLHGVRTPREQVTASLKNWRLHLAILGATFVLFPILGLVTSWLVAPFLAAPVVVGILFLSAVPSTVQSSIAFTSIARGNVSGAVAAATISNIAGIFITPFIVWLLVSVQSGGVSLSSVGSIFIQLLLPFIVGQIVRPWLGEWAAKRKKILSWADKTTIVLAVYSAFSAAVMGGLLGRMDAQTLAILVAVCCFILAIVIFVTRTGSRLLGFSREDEITTVFCGSLKTLASGVPMARVMFAGPDLGAILLPLMIFHQLQLMVCAWLARQYSRREQTNEEPAL